MQAEPVLQHPLPSSALADGLELFYRGQIISHAEMSAGEQYSLQAGMNYRPRGKSYSIVLMSQRKGARYPDQVVEEGRRILYVGHNVKRTPGGPDPQRADQQARTSSGSLSENGKFCRAADEYLAGCREAERVRVYEKIKDNIWTYNGLFALVDYSYVFDGVRKVFRFTLDILPDEIVPDARTDLSLSRVIPSFVKREVWIRDGGRCRICGATADLHFDHDIPWAKGGSSLTVANVQLLCGRHNLQKSDKIQ